MHGRRLRLREVYVEVWVRVWLALVHQSARQAALPERGSCFRSVYLSGVFEGLQDDGWVNHLRIQ